MNKKNFNIGVATKASLFFIPRRERKRTSTPLPPRNKSIVKPPPPLFFERVITRDTMHANPDILDGNAISGRRRGEGEGTNPPLVDKIEKRITRRWSRASEKDRRWRAPPFTGRASPLWFSHYRRGGLSLSSPPTSNSKSASFHIAPRFSYFFSAYIVVGTRPRASSFLPLEGEGRRVNFSLLPLPRKRELHPQTTISAMLIPDHRREIMFDGNRLGRDSIALLL